MPRHRIRPYLALCLAITLLGVARRAGAARRLVPGQRMRQHQADAGGRLLQECAECVGGVRRQRRHVAVTRRFSAAATLGTKWGAADAKASTKGTNCATHTVGHAAQTLIDSALNALVATSMLGSTSHEEATRTAGRRSSPRRRPRARSCSRRRRLHQEARRLRRTRHQAGQRPQRLRDEGPESDG